MIRSTKLTILLIIAAVLASCAPTKNINRPEATAGQKAKITGLISTMPAAGQAERQWLNEELLEFGPEGIRALTGMLVAPGAGDDTFARYAVNGLAKYVSRPGAVTERSMYEKVLLEELKSDIPKPVKFFLMQQLELAGSDKSVKVLRNFLTDDVLYGPAIQTLTAIRTSNAKSAVHQALSTTEDNQRMAIIKALGDMQVSSAVQDIFPYTSSDNPQIRNTAWYALANIGNPAASGIFAQAVDASQSSGHSEILSYYVLFAKRLGEEGYKQQSSDICHKILADEYPAHIKIDALTTLVQNGNNQALDDLLAAAEDANPELRSTALSLARSLSGQEVTQAWIIKLKQSTPAVQADIITMMGKRGDASALPALTSFLQDSNPDIRLAAIPAVAMLGGTEKLPDLIEVLRQSNQPEEIKAVKTALLQMSSRDLLPAASRALPIASGHAKIALIEILAERRATQYLDQVLNQRTGPDSAVRLAVYQSLEALATPDDLSQLVNLITNTQNINEQAAITEAIVAVSKDIPGFENRADAVLKALEKAPDIHKPQLLKILPGIGGEKALNAVVEAIKSSSGAVKNAAFSALAGWPDASAVPALIDAAKNTSKPNRVTALEGCVRLVGNSSYSSEDKVRFLKDAIAVAQTPPEKGMVMEALATIHTPGALKALAAYFNDNNQAIRDEAANAAARILAPEYNVSSSSFNGATAALSIVETTASPQLKQQIERRILDILARKQAEQGFVSLFNGRNLSGWMGEKNTWYVKDGALISRPDGHGNLYTQETYSDFVLRFEFKLTLGANNGLGIRAPLEGDPAYAGMELQILDNTAEKYSGLEPYQYHGSVYGIVPAKRGYLKPAGEWNRQEVIARGSHITVKLNGETILDADVGKASTPDTPDGKEHPGLLRNRGHIGFLGHGAEVAFRNIRIRDLNEYFPDYSLGSGNRDGLNQPPDGFKTLFNGENLDGWKGLVGNPETRAGMSAEELARAQAKADSVMRRHWSVQGGILYFDGEGESLTTVKDYGDFEMLVDWKIEPHGDSGIYLRGSPQVQIWDITENPQGSGGLYNNQKNLGNPLAPADNPIGEWNTMRIKMIGERVTVHLNGELVVPNIMMENYWNRDKPIYSKGQIELQSHNTPLYFRNIFIREIPRTEKLFNGKDLTGWERIGGEPGTLSGWHVDDGILFTEGGGEEWQKTMGGSWLSTTGIYGNFKLELEYRLPEGGNSGVFLRAPRKGDPAYAGLEIQILDDYASQYEGLEPPQYTGSIYDVKAPSKRTSKPAGQWQKMMIICDGPKIKVSLNGQMIINTNLIDHMDRVSEHPGLKRREGYIGLQNHNTRIEYRNINITEIE